jgi:hypothetical protein
VGSREDYREFTQSTGLTVDHQEVDHPAELAQWISGMNQVIATTSGWAIPIAQALNKHYLVQSLDNVQQWNNPYVMAERGNNAVF